MASFCKDCIHLIGGVTCNRPVDLGVNVVSGQDETRVLGWDAAHERRGGTQEVFGVAIELCGPDAKFFSAKPADWKEPALPVEGDPLPAAVRRQREQPENPWP